MRVHMCGAGWQTAHSCMGYRTQSPCTALHIAHCIQCTSSQTDGRSNPDDLQLIVKMTSGPLTVPAANDKDAQPPPIEQQKVSTVDGHKVVVRGCRRTAPIKTQELML